jgi:hypothetical protein
LSWPKQVQVFGFFASVFSGGNMFGEKNNGGGIIVWTGW